MTTIRSIFTLLLTVVAFNVATAQQGQIPADEQASNRTRKMTKELNLQGDQITQVQEINTAYFKAVDELKKKKASQTEIDAENNNYRQQMKKVLTEEQFKRLEAWEKNKQAEKQK
jgi:Spy/CpxP family protein refolding chaperone